MAKYMFVGCGGQIARVVVSGSGVASIGRFVLPGVHLVAPGVFLFV